MRLTVILAAILCLSARAMAQGAAQNPFAGGLPSGQPAAGVLALTLSEAMDRGLKYNLGLALSQQGTRTAEAARLRALSGLLPNAGIRV